MQNKCFWSIGYSLQWRSSIGWPQKNDGTCFTANIMKTTQPNRNFANNFALSYTIITCFDNITLMSVLFIFHLFGPSCSFICTCRCHHLASYYAKQTMKAAILQSFCATARKSTYYNKANKLVKFSSFFCFRQFHTNSFTTFWLMSINDKPTNKLQGNLESWVSREIFTWRPLNAGTKWTPAELETDAAICSVSETFSYKP